MGSTLFELAVGRRLHEQAERMRDVGRNIAGRPAFDLIDARTQRTIRDGKLRERIQNTVEEA